MRVSVRTACLWLLAASSLAAAEPKAAFLHTPPAEAKAQADLVVEGSLTGDPMVTVSVKVRAPGKAFESVALELQYGDLYRGTIPGTRLSPPFIEYYVEGTTKLGEVVPLFATSAKPVKVTVPGTAPVEPKPEVRPDPPPEEKPVQEPPPKPKCKKTKKGKKCEEEPAPPPEEKPVEPKPDAVESKPVEPKPSEKKAEPKPVEPNAEAKPTEKKPADRKAEEPKPVERSEPPRKRTDLEEELAMYSAEETGAVVQRVEESSARMASMPTILTQPQLKQLGVRYVFEAIDLVPGVSVSRDVQGTFRAGIRGLSREADLLITLNGQRLNAFYDAKALANLPIDTLERIEIYRGPATPEVGLGNFIALINLVTNRQQGLRVSGTGGLFGAFDGHLSAAKTFGGFTIFGDADVLTQQGAKRQIVRDGLDTPTTTTEKFVNDRRFLVNIGLGAAYENEAFGKVTLQGRVMSERRAAYIGRYDTVGNDSQLDWLVIQAQAAYERRIGEAGRLTASLWFDQQNTDRLWQLSPDGFQFRANAPDTLFPDGALEQQRVAQRALGLNVKLELPLPAKNRLTATVSAELANLTDYALLSNYEPLSSGVRVRDGGLARGVNLGGSDVAYPTDGPPGTRGPAADRLGFGISVFDTWTPFEALTLQAGARVDFTSLPKQSEGVFTGSTLVPSFGPRVGIALAPVKSFVLRGTYGRAFRPPTPQELAESAINSDFNQGRFVGNPRLEGQYVDSVELGFEWVQSLGDARLRLKGLGFFNRFTAPIAQLDSTGNLAPYVNRPQGAQTFGLEGEGRLELLTRSSVWLNSSWFRAEDLGAAQNGRLLTDQPQVRVNAGFSLALGPFLNLDVILRHASERRSNARTALEQRRRYVLPPTFVTGVQLRTEPLFDRVEVLVIGQNVFNLERADESARPDRMPGGVPREPFQIFGTIRVNL